MCFQAFLIKRGWLESGADTGSGRVAACVHGDILGPLGRCGSVAARSSNLEYKDLRPKQCWRMAKG